MAIARTEFVVEGAQVVEKAIEQQTRAIERNTAAQSRQNTEVRRARTEYGQANDAAQLLGRTFGVQLPREVNRFLASSRLIGPLLANAFNIALLGGFAVALVALIPKIRSLASEIGGLTAATREWGEELAKANVALLTSFTSSNVGRQFQRQTNDRIEALEREKAVLEEMSKLRGLDATSISTAVGARLRLREVEDELVSLSRRRIQISERMTEVVNKENEENKKLNQTLEAQRAAAEKLLAAQIARFTAASGRLPADIATRQALQRAAGLPTIPAPDIPLSSVPGMPLPEEVDRVLDTLARIPPATRQVTSSFEEWRRSVQSLGFELRNLAESPLEYLKQRFKQAMFEMVAASLLGAQGITRNLFSFLFPGTFGGGFGAPLPGIGFGGATAPGGTPTFTGAPIGSFAPSFTTTAGPNQLPLFGGQARIDAANTTLSAGTGVGPGTSFPSGAAGGDLFSIIRQKLGGNAQLTRGQSLFAGIAGIIGGLLSGSSNRGLRTIGGALTGASIGTMVLPGIGTAIGAVIGGLVGLFTGPNLGKQRDRFLRDQFQPSVDNVIKAFELHQLDYNSAIAQLESLRQQGVQQLRSLKGDGHRASDAVDNAIAKINQVERQRLINAGLIAGLPSPEFDRGGFVPAVTGTLGQPVNIIAHRGEAILNLQQQAMVGPERIRAAFRATSAGGRGKGAGNSFADGGFVSDTGIGGGAVHLHFHGTLIDGEGVKRAVRELWPEMQRQIRRSARSQAMRVPV